MKEIFTAESYRGCERDDYDWRNTFTQSYNVLSKIEEELEPLISVLRSSETSYEQKGQAHKEILSYAERVTFEENRITSYKQCQITFHSACIGNPHAARDTTTGKIAMVKRLLADCQLFEEKLCTLHRSIFDIKIESDKIMHKIEKEQDNINLASHIMQLIAQNNTTPPTQNSTEESATPLSANSLFGTGPS